PEIVCSYEGDTPLLRVEIELVDDVMMPAVRCYMTLAAIADHGETIHSTPGSDDVDTFDGRRIEAWVVTEHEHATIDAAVRAVPDVGAVTISVADAATEGKVATPEPETAAEAKPETLAPAADKPAAPAAPTGGTAPAAHGRSAMTVRVDA